MSFDLKYLPQQFSDLVIADPNNAAIIQSYVLGPPAKPLLLAGVPGAGKTEAARIIAKSYFAQRDSTAVHWEHNGASVTKTLDQQFMSEANVQKISMNVSDKAVIVINEIDEMDLRTVQPIFRQFMDDKRHLFHFIATTNYKNRLMGALLSRFRVVDLTPPSNLDWVPRVKSILEAEGLNPSTADVVQMLAGFTGSARELIDFVEESVFTSRSLQQSVASQVNRGATP